MTRYVAAFYTELAALRSLRALKTAGLSARMAPVPRELSASCGSCVIYDAPAPCAELMDEDTEAVYLSSGTADAPQYTRVWPDTER